MVRTRAALMVALIAALSACKTTGTPPPAIEIRTVERVVEVQRPCTVTKPARPAPLARPLPTDAVALAAVLAEKLAEWSGPGRYGDRADAAINRCTAP